MGLTLFLLFLVIGSIEVHFFLDSGPELLQNPSVTSDDMEIMVLELALESLKLGQKCQHSKLFCCKGGQVLQTDGVCFLFGKGHCEARFNIPNYSRYVKLAKKVKKSNYRVLCCQYWKEVLPPFLYRAFLRGL